MLNSTWDFFEAGRNSSTVGISIAYKVEIITTHDALPKAELLGLYFINFAAAWSDSPQRSLVLCFSAGMISVRVPL